VMGRHLLELGVPPGPEMGRLLDDCYEAQLDGLFTSLDEGLAYARHKIPSSAP
jgi:tRNA nucleotidyltransferase (CCA-adding enzyme)